MKNERLLTKTNDTKNDKVFLRNLAKYIAKHYGNINVAQRLNVIAIKGKVN